MLLIAKAILIEIAICVNPVMKLFPVAKLSFGHCGNKKRVPVPGWEAGYKYSFQGMLRYS
jgi:hypothetical protein